MFVLNRLVWWLLQRVSVVMWMVSWCDLEFGSCGRDGRTKYIWLECSTLACRTSGRQTMRYFDVSVKSTVPHQLIFHDGTTDGEPHGLDSSIDATFTLGGNKGARRQPSRNYNGQFAVLRAPISPLQMSSRERNESPHQRQSLRFTTSY